MLKRGLPLKVRLLLSVEVKQGCWLWNKTKTKDGYGKIQINGKTQLAHRAAWQAFRGLIPEGLWVLHKCDVPKCINPKHLFLGNNSDNMKDMFKKGRQPKTSLKPLIGEENPKAKLSVREVNQIRTEYNYSDITQKQLAKKYNVSQQMISNIINNKNWVDEL